MAGTNSHGPLPQVVNDPLYSANAGSPPPPLFFLPTQRASGWSKCFQHFSSCAKRKQNFHSASESSGGAPCAPEGGQDPREHASPVVRWAQGA